MQKCQTHYTLEKEHFGISLRSTSDLNEKKGKYFWRKRMKIFEYVKNGYFSQKNPLHSAILV